jgi:hypothetical protein
VDKSLISYPKSKPDQSRLLAETTRIGLNRLPKGLPQLPLPFFRGGTVRATEMPQEVDSEGAEKVENSIDGWA